MLGYTTRIYFTDEDGREHPIGRWVSLHKWGEKLAEHEIVESAAHGGYPDRYVTSAAGARGLLEKADLGSLMPEALFPQTDLAAAKRALAAVPDRTLVYIVEWDES